MLKVLPWHFPTDESTSLTWIPENKNTPALEVSDKFIKVEVGVSVIASSHAVVCATP